MKYISSFILLSLCSILGSTVAAEPIVIDHGCTGITQIPGGAIEQAKTDLHIAYGHTSHGSQLTTGMTGLVSFANLRGLGLAFPQDFFQWNNGGSGGALDLHDYAMDGDCGYYPEWVNNTVNYLGVPDPVTGRGSNNPDVNVIIWAWCGQVGDKFAAGTLGSEYLTPMESLENQYPAVTFVYMTGHVDHWNDINNKAANQMIRDFCIANEKVLYDFADIESYDPDGIFYEFPSDNCDYYDSVNGAKLGNWATEWQNSHVVNTDWYNCSSAHSEPLNANLKSYAAWWLWARLAGWNPGVETDDDGDGFTENQGDCNDSDVTVYPGATEICDDGIDQDCNGSDLVCTPISTWYEDVDIDGYGNVDSFLQSETQPPGYVADNTDCNDNNADIYPGCPEICNGIDEDCDGQVDEGLPVHVYYRDADGDGYGNTADSIQSCSQPSGYVTDNADCDDNNANIHPDGDEICNGSDDNCDGSTDEGVTTIFYRDADGDGFGNSAEPSPACSQPTGYVEENTDCNDGNPNIHPGATETCGDDVDQDCNGSDLVCTPSSVWYEDVDSDGYGNPDSSTQSSSQPSGYVAVNTDCDDSNADIHPGRSEVCNGVDDDCDGSVDEDVATTYYRDADGDGFGTPSVSTQACVQPSGYVLSSTDCDDNNASIYLGAIEHCNGIDEDCNGQVDEGIPVHVYYRDGDGDGYGDPGDSTQACSQPSGYVTDNTDCNDGDANLHPGVTEICDDGIDQDCNGSDLVCADDETPADLDIDNFDVVQVHGGNTSIILESSSGTILRDCQAVDNPSPVDVPAGYNFPYGLFSFSIDTVSPGDSTIVKIVLPADSELTTYYKYGPTPDDPANHWYEFLYDGKTGAVINGNIITLHFIDGKRGDSDLDDTNGEIVDPGGPSTLNQVLNNPAGAANNDDDSSGCFIGKLTR